MVLTTVVMRLSKRTLAVSIALLTVGLLYKRSRAGPNDTQA
jgi:hypothetical protein